MRLENLYPDINQMTDTEAQTFILSYTNSRTTDLSKTIPSDTQTIIKKRALKSTDKKVELSTEQIEILKKLKLL